MALLFKRHRSYVKVGTVSALMYACDMIHQSAPSLMTPVFVQHGTHDTSVHLEATRRFLDRIPVEDKSLVEVEGAYHDLAHDPETQAVISRVVAWLGKRV
jgi:alpha-beta hydrolase superfamily lysophospholipase